MKQSQLRFYLYGMLLSPIIAALTAFGNFRSPDARKYLWIFSGLLGFYLIVPEGYDGSRHAANVANHYFGLPFLQFVEEAWQLILFNPPAETNDDIFLHIISYLSSFFGGSPNVFFLIVSLIYSYFYINTIGLVYDLMPKNKSAFLIALFMLLVLWKGWEGINSVRSWTGGWIFLFGVLNYLKTRQKKFLIYILLTPMIHFAYFLFFIPFWIFYFFGNKPILYFVVFALSYVFSATMENASFMRDIGSITKLSEQKLDTYAIDNERHAERYGSSVLEKQSRQSFHKRVYNKVTNNFAILFLMYIILRFGYLGGKIKSLMLNGLISTTLCLLSLSNFLGGVIPQVYNRGLVIAGLLTMSVGIIIFSQWYMNRQYFSRNILNNLMLPIKTASFVVLALVIFHQSSALSYMMNSLLLVSPLTYFVFDEQVSIRDLIRYLF
jgi:hypothetical protein